MASGHHGVSLTCDENLVSVDFTCDDGRYAALHGRLLGLDQLVAFQRDGSLHLAVVGGCLVELLSELEDDLGVLEGRFTLESPRVAILGDDHRRLGHAAELGRHGVDADFPHVGVEVLARLHVPGSDEGGRHF